MTFLGDIFFGGSKRVYKKEFNRALRKMPIISKDERKYLNKTFKQDLKDGLSEYEVKRRIEKLRRISTDPIDPNELKRVKRQLLGKFKK